MSAAEEPEADAKPEAGAEGGPEGQGDVADEAAEQAMAEPEQALEAGAGAGPVEAAEGEPAELAIDEDRQPTDVTDKLFLNTFHHSGESHIAIRDRQVCVGCENKECTTFCPGDVYHWNEDEQKIDIGYENCIECTAARYACPYNNIDWVYPKGGHGIEYKYG